MALAMGQAERICEKTHPKVEVTTGTVGETGLVILAGFVFCGTIETDCSM